MLKTLGKLSPKNTDTGKTDFGFYIPYTDIGQFLKNPFFIDYEIFGIYLFLFTFVKNIHLKNLKLIT